MTTRYDAVVIGTGNAGMGAAGALREADRSVAMVESRDVGGTCPLRGCVPKKVLVAAAQVLHQIALAGEHGIQAGKPAVDWAKLIDREQGFVEGVPEAFAASLEGRGIELHRGRARFRDRTSLEVDGATLEADKIVIASGSRPRPLEITGAEHLITSDEILETRTLPESIVFIGGGVIALEFSHVYVRAGCKVTILEVMPSLLPRMDSDAVTALQQESERIGIDILTEVEITTIDKAGKDLIVNFKHDGRAKSLRAACVANGTGRIANVDGLELDAGQIDHDGLRISVDEYLCSTSNRDVYVAGDALWSSAQLSPVATYEGRIAARNILNGNTVVPEYSSIPSAVYTVPALASVGMTEEEAMASGLDVDVRINDLRDWRSSRTYAETAAYSKVVLEAGSGRILGAHLLGHGGEETIHLFAFAMKHGLTKDDLVDTVYGYPTFSSDLKNML